MSILLLEISGICGWAASEGIDLSQLKIVLHIKLPNGDNAFCYDPLVRVCKGARGNEVVIEGENPVIS